MDKSEPSRVIGLAGDVALILAFCCIPIGAGHGIGPLGLLLLDGNLVAWRNPFSVGRIGIALVAIGILIPKRSLYFPLELAGLLMIVLTWLLIAFENGHVVIYFVFSIPFLAVLAARLVYFRLQLKRP